MGKYKDLPDQIWTTRISRVNAEKRLINKEAFFQAINIYYSCVTIIFSILTLLDNNEKLSLMVIDKAMREHWANPSSLYAPGARSEEAQWIIHL